MNESFDLENSLSPDANRRSDLSRHWQERPPVEQEHILKSDAETVAVRAVNNDNRREAQKLVDLFESHYGNSHPFGKVYDTVFWSRVQRRRIDSGGLVSMVALENDHFVAHLAVDYDECTNSLQILLPAIHPDYRSRLFPIIRAFWNHIEKSVSRHGWQSVITYSISSQPMLELLAAKCFRSSAVALLPAATCSYSADRHADLDGPRSDILVMYSGIEDNGHLKRKLFPPVEHTAKIEELFSALSLKRTLISPEDSADADIQRDVSTSDRGDLRLIYPRGFSPHFFKSFGLYLVRLTPRQLAAPSATVSAIRRLEYSPKKNPRTIAVHVPLDHPDCPLFCRQLEENGYDFVGILPMLGNHDYVLYANLANRQSNELQLYSSRSKSLSQYIFNRKHLN